MSEHPEPHTAPDLFPAIIVTETSEEFFALCARADAGELVIESFARGEGNAQWVCRVRYCELEQIGLNGIGE